MINKLVLPNGVRILTESIPYVRSVSFGLFVGSGSRAERSAESGASHFIEHMVFKGTKTRSAAEIAALSDELGGQINAYTTKESTCFYGRVLDTHLPKLMDMLCDMVLDTRFDEADVQSERDVIGEEIDMYADTPEDLVSERLFAAVFAGTPLARPILGTRRSLAKMDGAFLRQYMRAHYAPERIVAAVSGSFTDADVRRLTDRLGAISAVPAVRLPAGRYTPAFTVKKKAIEQNHLCLCFPGLAVGDPDRHAMQLLVSILGGGSSSRLFQSMREERGLCYSVYAYHSSYADTGLIGIYTALNREAEREALALACEELRKFLDDGVTEEELRRTREQMKANMLMGLESTGNRMSYMGGAELSLGETPDMDTRIARLDAVTADDILALARRCFDPAQAAFSAVGRVDGADAYREQIRL